MAGEAPGGGGEEGVLTAMTFIDTALTSVALRPAPQALPGELPGLALDTGAGPSLGCIVSGKRAPALKEA